MTKYCNIEDNVVIQVQPNGDKDFIECPEWVHVGCKYVDGKFVEPTPEPTPEPTIQEQLYALDAQQTPRMLRNAALGDEYAIEELQRIETEAAVLRELL